MVRNVSLKIFQGFSKLPNYQFLDWFGLEETLNFLSFHPLPPPPAFSWLWDVQHWGIPNNGKVDLPKDVSSHHQLRGGVHLMGSFAWPLNSLYRARITRAELLFVWRVGTIPWGLDEGDVENTKMRIIL